MYYIYPLAVMYNVIAMVTPRPSNQGKASFLMVLPTQVSDYKMREEEVWVGWLILFSTLGIEYNIE